MKIQWTGLLIALIAVCAPLTGRADDAAVRQALEAQYARGIQAFKHKDVHSLMALSTPDMTETLPNRRVLTRSQIEANLKRQIAGIQPGADMTNPIHNIVVQGNRAIVSAGSTVTLPVLDRRRRRHTFVEKDSTRDTWVKVGQDWKLKHIEVLKSVRTLDGKPFRLRPVRRRVRGRYRTHR